MLGHGLVLAAIALAELPARGDTNQYAGSNWALVDVKKVMAAAAEITPAKYPDCDEATVEQKSVRVYQADGTGECQDETFVKVLTEKGKRNNRTLTMNFMLPYTTVAVPKLEVIKPDGETVPVDVAANSNQGRLALASEPHQPRAHLTRPDRCSRPNGSRKDRAGCPSDP